MKTTLALLLVFTIFIYGAQATLYGYYSSGQSSTLVSIDPSTAATTTVCDLSALPMLLGGSTASISATGQIMFYNISTEGNITLYSVSVPSCKVTSTPVTGLNPGQNDVRDIKYNALNGQLYMVFPNPFCMHGSLDALDPNTGAVVTHLNNVVDPQGLAQTAGLSGVSGNYYFVGVPLGADTLDYQLNKVALTTGNITAINLANNNIDVGDMWGSNYTLNVATTKAGDVIVGAVSPSSTTVEECDPSGFYQIDPSNGNVTCVNGPINYAVYPLAELDESTLYYYQIFNDESYNFYLYTFDIQNKKVVYSTPCKICSKLSILAAV